MYGTCDLYSVNLSPNFFFKSFLFKSRGNNTVSCENYSNKNWSAVQTGVVQVVNAKDA